MPLEDANRVFDGSEKAGDALVGGRRWIILAPTFAPVAPRALLLLKLVACVLKCVKDLTGSRKKKEKKGEGEGEGEEGEEGSTSHKSSSETLLQSAES